MYRGFCDSAMLFRLVSMVKPLEIVVPYYYCVLACIAPISLKGPCFLEGRKTLLLGFCLVLLKISLH